MIIYSYNINGLRSAIKNNLIDWLINNKIDILCLQEIKTTESEINIKLLNQCGFIYNYFYSSEIKGYSGIAILSKYKPKKITIGIGINDIDKEARIMQADFDNFSIINLYFPSGSNIYRINFKMKFCYTILKYIEKLKKNIKNLIILGDYNICHKKIDIHNPIKNAYVSGFLSIERKWFDLFIKKNKMLDTFRLFNKEPHHYTWWSYRNQAKKNNKGWRIDYIMITNSLQKNIKNSGINTNIQYSDHCPIWIEIIF